jgi:hypothetical protein
MVAPTHHDVWMRFGRWARRYASASVGFVSDHAQEGDWHDPRWLAFATQMELQSPEAWEGVGDLGDEIRRRVQQKSQFLHAYLVEIAPDGPSFMSKNVGFLPWQYPSKCEHAWGFWFQQTPDGDLEPGSVPSFQELEGQLFLRSPEDADFGSIRNVLPFDYLAVRRPRGEHWSIASTKALVAVLRGGIERDGYRFKVDAEGGEDSLLRLEFRWMED